MPLLPTKAALEGAFADTSLAHQNRITAPSSRTKYQARQELYGACSVADDAKTKVAQKIEQASSNVQSKTSHMELHSPKFYAACVLGGAMACGFTHAAVTPLDLVKCRRQVDSKMYKGNFEAWGKISRAEGLRGIFTGWGPTFVGYSFQGAFKYGGYEFFKKYYSDLAGPEKAKKYQSAIFLAGSASAEFLACIALCPFESVKVRMQTTMPPFATGTMSGINKVIGQEGWNGLYKGIGPLWGRQIPYTMMKFFSFEKTVQAIWAYLPGSKSEYGKGAQTAVSFAGGYIAGIACAIVSHPADVMVSKLNADRRAGEALGAAMSRIYKDIGFGGLWNGLPVRIVMIGTLTGLQWTIYDSWKILMGFPTTGGK